MIKRRYPNLGIYPSSNYTVVKSLPWGGSELSFFSSASPAIANGDFSNTPLITAPDAYPVALSSTGVPVINSNGSTARQTVPVDVYRIKTRQWYGRVIDYINDLAPSVNSVAQSFTYIQSLPITDLDVSAFASDPEGDALVISTASTLPPGLTLQSNVLTGTATTVGVYSVTFKATDVINQSTNFPVWTFNITIPVPIGSTIPVFVGPDFSPLNILQTDSGSKDTTALFTLENGTKSYSNVGASPTGVSFAAGVYSYAGSQVPGTYAMITRCSGSVAPIKTVDYPWTLKVNAVVGGIAPVFTGPIANQSQSANFTFDTTGYATGQTSYSTASFLPTGITFNAGVFTIDVALSGLGTFSPFVVTYTNSTGSTDSNAFSITIVPPSGGSSDYSDATLQRLLDPQNDFTGIRIITRISPTDLTKIEYYVIPHMLNRGQSMWVEVFVTDTAQQRADKIIAATTIEAQPTWPLPTNG